MKKKKRMGRPPLPEQEKMFRVNTTMPPDVYEYLKANFASVSAGIRQLVNEHKSR